MKLFGFLKGNWGLKLLALLLAVVIYYTLRNESAARGHGHDRNILQQSR